MYPDEQKICYKCATPALITCSRIGYLFTGRWSYDRYLFTGRTTAARPGLVEVTGGNRHRLSRAGNRRINRTLHIMAVVQLRNDTEGRADYRRKLAAGKTPIEALRCVKRRLSDVVYRQMVADAKNVE